MTNVFWRSFSGFPAVCVWRKRKKKCQRSSRERHLTSTSQIHINQARSRPLLSLEFAAVEAGRPSFVGNLGEISRAHRISPRRSLCFRSSLSAATAGQVRTPRGEGLSRARAVFQALSAVAQIRVSVQRLRGRRATSPCSQVPVALAQRPLSSLRCRPCRKATENCAEPISHI